MPRAIVRIREQPWYRRDAFVRGLVKAGYQLDVNGEGRPGDVLVIWNRYGVYEMEADRWEASGGTVLVAENGYLGEDDQGRQLYALSIHGHNGSGKIAVGTEDRMSKLGLHIAPWRKRGKEIIVRGQRGIGTAVMRSPPNWHLEISKKLAKHTNRPIRVVEHPGKDRHLEPVEQYLEDAWAVVIWSSALGVKSLSAGVPVVYGAPFWICSDAAQKLESALKIGVENWFPPMEDPRPECFRKMCYGQWTVDELESGEPFSLLRSCM